MSRRMVCFLGLIFCIFVDQHKAFSNETSVKKNEFKVGYFLAKPLVLLPEESDQLSGIVIDIFDDYIAPKMNVTIKWFQYPFQRLLLETEKGELDAIAFLAKNSERSARFHYPEKAVGFIDPVLLMKNSYALSQISSPKDLKGRKIAVVKGLFVPPYLTSSDITLDQIDSSGDPHAQMLGMVHLDRVDLAYLATYAGARWEVKMLKKSIKGKLEGKNDFRLLKVPESRSELYTVFSKKASKEMIKKYEAALKDWTMDQYQTYLSKYTD